MVEWAGKLERSECRPVLQRKVHGYLLHRGQVPQTGLGKPKSHTSKQSLQTPGGHDPHTSSSNHGSTAAGTVEPWYLSLIHFPLHFSSKSLGQAGMAGETKAKASWNRVNACK